MNAAPPVFQAQPSSDAVQPDAPDSAASATTRAGSQDFAAALSDAGGKLVRKSTAHRQQDHAVSGSSLPVPGQPPPSAVTPPPQATTESLAGAAAAAAADAAAKLKGGQGSAQGSQSDAIAAASTAPTSVGGATGISALPNLDPATPQGPAVQADLPAPPNSAMGVDATAPSAVDPASAGSGLTLPHAVSMRTPAAPGTASAVAAPKLPAGNASTASSGDATAKQGTTASANSASSSTDADALNDSTQNIGPASGTGADAAAQVAMAAAIAQGNSPVPDSASTDDFSGSNSDLPSGAAAVSGPSADTPAAGAAAAAAAAVLAQVSAAAISAATTAATAASVAQAVLAAASTSTSAADKRSHGNSPDSTLSGASNDSSAGAAQLLTSNTATDSAPTPTLRVAAGVDTAQFGQGVADRVSMMMDGNLTSAKLQVNPPALGPIEVRIALQGGHAQISFSSHSAVTRDALESSSTNLKDMLGSQGFSSVSVDISQRSFQERSPQSQAYESAPSHSGNVPVLAQASVSASRSASGLLDAYA
jgi:flagellar hook-length control protein FliK